MSASQTFLPDLVEIQRNGFCSFLKKGIIEEISKRNPITCYEKEIEIFFYPEYYKLTKPYYSVEQAIFYKKSYVSKLYIPVQITDRRQKRVFLKWILLAHFPLMTNRGHFVLNGSARVIIHQLVRSPGIYFRENLHEIYSNKWSEKPTTTYRRFYADIICLKGTWLRLESEKDLTLWAKMKKGPKIPLLWFLLGMGFSENSIFQSVSKPFSLLESFTKEFEKTQKLKSLKEVKYPYVSTPHQAWEQIQKLLKLKTTVQMSSSFKKSQTSQDENIFFIEKEQKSFEKKKTFDLLEEKKKLKKRGISKVHPSELGRKWFSNKFMNPRTYDLGKQGRLSLNKKLGLSVSFSETTLTALDVLTATDVLMKMEDGFFQVDDIDHLKNKRVRTAAESIQEVFSLGFLRFEKSLRLKFPTFLNVSSKKSSFENFSSLFSTRPINGVFREFFGTHPLSQFMDQMNPLSEITHKRRLTSLGPGGVSRDTATLAIRGIHPSHYGRICPIETPEGKNTGLVNSFTTYAKISMNGFLESPFHKVLKGQIQKNLGVFFLSPDEEEHFHIATPDLELSSLGFFPQNPIPVRLGKRFVRMKSQKLAFMGVSPLQMISVATAFIPFLEHDDANRALMGSNMQRQAVPLMRCERPFVGTGLESRVISDSGHALFSKKSGYILSSSGSKILLYTFK